MNTPLYLTAVIAPFAFLALLVCKTMPVRTALSVSVPSAMFFAALVLIDCWPVMLVRMLP